MEKDEFLKYKKDKKIIINRQNRRKKNIKINRKMVIYISLIILFLLLFTIIIIIYTQKKRIPFNYINNNREEFTIAKKLFKNKENEDEYGNYNNISEIHISYSLDNKFIYPTFISMLSGLENNNNNNSILIYHLLLSHDFNTSKVEIFESLKKNYTVKINYYVIPNIFSDLKKWSKGTDCVYYKIILPFMFPDLKRIIYLDGDTLIRKDISEMYNSPFNDNYILGFPFFYMPQVMSEFGMKSEKYINGGCLLFNIEKIRKDKKDVDLLQFTIKNNSVLKFREQDSINYIFYPNIGFLPLKYGIYMIGSKNILRDLMKFSKATINMTEGYEAIDDPGLVHFSCCYPKIWRNGTKNLFKDDHICIKYQKEFYYYANKTQYYSEIYNSLFFKKKRIIHAYKYL